MRILFYLIYVSILILVVALLRLQRRAYEALGGPQPTLRARAV